MSKLIHPFPSRKRRFAYFANVARTSGGSVSGVAGKQISDNRKKSKEVAEHPMSVSLLSTVSQ